MDSRPSSGLGFGVRLKTSHCKNKGVQKRHTGPRNRTDNLEELHSLYRSPNVVRVIKSRRLRLAGHVARMEEDRSAFKILTGKPTGMRPLGRSRRR